MILTTIVPEFGKAFELFAFDKLEVNDHFGNHEGDGGGKDNSKKDAKNLRGRFGDFNTHMGRDLFLL